MPSASQVELVVKVSGVATEGTVPPFYKKDDYVAR